MPKIKTVVSDLFTLDLFYDLESFGLERIQTLKCFTRDKSYPPDQIRRCMFKMV